MSDTYAAESRRGWHRPGDTKPTTDDLKLGCLQRIADATEAMAKNHIQLAKQLEFYKQYSSELQDKLNLVKGQLRAARGQVTRLKNRQVP